MSKNRINSWLFLNKKYITYEWIFENSVNIWNFCILKKFCWRLDQIGFRRIHWEEKSETKYLDTSHFHDDLQRNVLHTIILHVVFCWTNNHTELYLPKRFEIEFKITPIIYRGFLIFFHLKNAKIISKNTEITIESKICLCLMPDSLWTDQDSEKHRIGFVKWPRIHLISFVLINVLII